MDDLTKKHLQDILTAIEEIESFFGSEPKLYDDFYSNLCLRRAVERNIAFIIKAVGKDRTEHKQFVNLMLFA